MGFGGGKGGGSSQSQSQSSGMEHTNQTGAFVPAGFGTFQNLVNAADVLTSAPYTPYTNADFGFEMDPFGNPDASNRFVAEVNPYEQQAALQTHELASRAFPDLSQAGDLANQVGGMGHFDADFGQDVGRLNEGQINEYLNPFQHDVINTTMANIAENNRRQQQDVLGNAATRGAIGGDRAAVAQAELARQQDLSTNQTLAGLNQQNYSTALQTAQQQQQVALANRQARLNIAGQQIGQRFGEQGQRLQAASQLGNIGAAKQAAYQQQLAATSALGARERDRQQSIINALYQQYLRRQGYPLQALQYRSGIQLPAAGAMGGLQNQVGDMLWSQQSSSKSKGPSPGGGGGIGGLLSLGKGLFAHGGAVHPSRGGRVPGMPFEDNPSPFSQSFIPSVPISPVQVNYGTITPMQKHGGSGGGGKGGGGGGKGGGQGLGQGMQQMGKMMQNLGKGQQQTAQAGKGISQTGIDQPHNEPYSRPPGNATPTGQPDTTTTPATSNYPGSGNNPFITTPDTGGPQTPLMNDPNSTGFEQFGAPPSGNVMDSMTPNDIVGQDFDALDNFSGTDDTGDLGGGAGFDDLGGGDFGGGDFGGGFDMGGIGKGAGGRVGFDTGGRIFYDDGGDVDFNDGLDSSIDPEDWHGDDQGLEPSPPEQPATFSERFQGEPQFQPENPFNPSLVDQPSPIMALPSGGFGIPQPGNQPTDGMLLNQPWTGLPAGTDPKSLISNGPYEGVPPGTDPKSLLQPLGSSIGRVDRGQFLSELSLNPSLVHKMASMVKGEVGLGPRVPLDKQIIQTESVLNRAMADKIPLRRALRSVSEGPGGYYARDTYRNPATPQQVKYFEDNILQPVLEGSDLGTKFLGSPVTGNASQMGFAGRRLASGEYAAGRWYGDEPGRDEMFVTEKRHGNFGLPENPEGVDPLNPEVTSQLANEDYSAPPMSRIAQAGTPDSPRVSEPYQGPDQPRGGFRDFEERYPGGAPMDITPPGATANPFTPPWMRGNVQQGGDMVQFLGRTMPREEYNRRMFFLRLGAGMLSSRSPYFQNQLGEGLQAALSGASSAETAGRRMYDAAIKQSRQDPSQPQRPPTGYKWDKDVQTLVPIEGGPYDPKNPNNRLPKVRQSDQSQPNSPSVQPTPAAPQTPAVAPKPNDQDVAENIMPINSAADIEEVSAQSRKGKNDAALNGVSRDISEVVRSISDGEMDFKDGLKILPAKDRPKVLPLLRDYDPNYTINTTKEPTINEETLKDMAEQAIAGDNTVFFNLGRGAQGVANVRALRETMYQLAKEKGVSPSEIALRIREMQGYGQQMRTLGSRAANISLARNEAQALLVPILQTSNVIDRTRYPDLNRLILAAQSRTGDENTVRYGLALNSFMEAYARALSPTGVATVDSRKMAREKFSEAYSKGQISGLVKQATYEMDVAHGAVRKTIQDLHNTMSGHLKGEPPAPMPEAPPPSPGGGLLSPRQQSTPDSGFPKPSSKEEYDAIPNGQRYIGRDGKVKIKQ